MASLLVRRVACSGSAKDVGKDQHGYPAGPDARQAEISFLPVPSLLTVRTGTYFCVCFF